MVSVAVVEPGGLDFDQHADLLKRSFKELLAGTGEEQTLSPAFFRWKYGGPLEDAKTALVLDGDRILATNSMFAMDVVWNGLRVRGWHSCDAATDVAARGKGYYVMCLNALLDRLAPDSIFFAFPNRNTVRGFSKVGCTEQQLLPAWVWPLPGWMHTGRYEAERISRFDADDTAMLAQYAVGRPPMIERTAAYLNWRYIEHPVAKYEAFAVRRHGRPSGVIVLRKVRMFGRTMALVMDFMAPDTQEEVALLGFAIRWAREQHAWPVVTFSTVLGVRHALRTALLPVPSALLPKRQIFMGQAIGDTAASVFREKWSLNLGDWDGL